MNDSSRRPRRPYPGLVASAEVRRSLLIGPLVLPRLPSLRCSVCVVRSLLPASEKRVAAHEECVGRFAKKKGSPSISRLVLASSSSTCVGLGGRGIGRIDEHGDPSRFGHVRVAVTGSSPETKTMGIVVVAALATNALVIGPAIAATCRRTHSVASADSRSI